MAVQWCRFAAAALCLVTGLVFMVLAVFGVNRFRKALNRMHAAAMGDTLGILFVFLGLMIMRGFSMDSLKLFLVILFFWMASPVSGHMISRLEAMTNEHLGEILVIDKRRTDDGEKNEKLMDGENTEENQTSEEKRKMNEKRKTKRDSSAGERRKDNESF